MYFFTQTQLRSFRKFRDTLQFQLQTAAKESRTQNSSITVYQHPPHRKQGSQLRANTSQIHAAARNSTYRDTITSHPPLNLRQLKFGTHRARLKFTPAPPRALITDTPRSPPPPPFKKVLCLYKPKKGKEKVVSRRGGGAALDDLADTKIPRAAAHCCARAKRGKVSHIRPGARIIVTAASQELAAAAAAAALSQPAWREEFNK